MAYSLRISGESIFQNCPAVSVCGRAEYNVSKNTLIDRAYALLKGANADLVVANDVGKKGSGFDVETNEVYIINKDKKICHVKLEDKRIIANKILDFIQ